MNESKHEKSFHRYAYTLFSTVCRTALGVITTVIVPNALGPKAIGTIAFGQIVAQNIRGLFDFGVNQVLFNLSVERRESGPITRLFFKIIATQFILTFVLTLALGLTEIGNKIAQGTPLLLLIILLVFEWAIFGVNLANQLGDTKGVSKWPQMITLFANLIMTFFIVFFAALKKLTIMSYLIIMLVFAIMSFISIITYLFQTNSNLLWKAEAKESLKKIFRPILNMSIPLTIAGYYGMGIEFVERSIIQYQYGAEEQAYFHIAGKWAAAIILFSTSSLQIFWQRLVETIASENLKAAGDIYLRLDGVLFYFTLCLALAWSFSGKDMLALLLSKDYKEAGTILMIMAFYPVSQVFGQIGNTIAIASKRTRELMKLYIITSTTGLIVSYLLIMPKVSIIPGLGLGGLGLGIKTAIFGLLATQPLTYFNCKYLSVSYCKLIITKAKILGSLVIIIIVLTYMGKIWAFMMPVAVESIIRAVLFISAAIILLFVKPVFCGVSSNDLDRLKNSAIINKLRLRF